MKAIPIHYNMLAKSRWLVIFEQLWSVPLERSAHVYQIKLNPNYEIFIHSMSNGNILASK